MPDCAACPLFYLEAEGDACLHVNRPGGLTLTKQALALSGLGKGSKVLEVASGAGITLDYLINEMGMNAVGMDASLAMLRYGKNPSSAPLLIQAEGGLIPLATRSRQAVVMECALSLAGDTPSALGEFNRVLIPGGVLIVTDIYVREAADPAGLACLAATHCLAGAMREEEIRSRINEGGFEILTWQDETARFKEWLAGMVFKLGSLKAFYRKLVACDADAEALCETVGNKIRLGYYVMVAKKRAT